MAEPDLKGLSGSARCQRKEDMLDELLRSHGVAPEQTQNLRSGFVWNFYDEAF